METWQIDWITKHSTELQRNTRCTVRLLNALVSKEILDCEEVTELDDEVRTAVKVNRFYAILMTRNCYDILSEELGNCKQDGAHKILQDGKAEQEKKMKEEGSTNHEPPPPHLRFEQGPKGLQDFLTSKENKVLLLSTIDVDVTMDKIRDNLTLPLVTAENKRHLRKMMLEYSTKSSPFPVFRCTEPPNSDFIGKVISWTSKGAKAILLTKDHRLSSLKNITALKISRDILGWSDMEYWFQEELLEKQVEIQVGGERRRVREIFDEARAEEELEDEKLILKLINDQTPALFRSIPAAFCYYVERKIRSRFVLSKNVIFKKGPGDIFLFTGIETVELSSYLSRCHHSSDNSSSQVSQFQVSVQYIIFEHTDHFDQICEKGKGKSVHWIHHEKGKFLWVKSGQGSMQRIQKATEDMTEQNEQFWEHEFISRLDSLELKYGNSPVLIADTPGMGKSTLLQSLARKIREKCFGTKLVLFVAFSDLINSIKTNLKKNSSDISTEIFEQTLAEVTTECGPELGKCILKSMLRSTSKTRNEIKVELMLDGYDEIHSNDLSLSTKVLTLIRNSYHSARIWVATRPHLMHDLENVLNVLGFTILPFDESDQENFLVEFWQFKNTKQRGGLNGSNIRHELEIFARRCLKNLKQIWAKSSEKEDICGVPLQCLLIAKVYLDDCLCFTNRDKLTTNTEPRLSLKVTSIKDLYEALIEKKLKIYTKRYAKELRPEMKMKILNIHYFFAMQLLFPEYAPVFESTLSVGSLSMTDILNVGIAKSIGEGIPKSLGHRTISEFLVARFLVEHICSEDGEIGKEILDNFLFDGVLRTCKFKREILGKRFNFVKFENEVLAFFLDSLFQERSLDKSKRFRWLVCGRNRPVEACVYGDHFHLFQAFRSGNEVVDVTTLFMAVSQVSKLFLEYICDEYNVKLVGNEVASRYTLLHVAVESREFSVVEFILNCQGFGELAKELEPSVQDVVHAVVVNSTKNPEWLIKEKILVLRKLVELNKDLVEVRDINGSTPILRESVHVQLILKLLELGANPVVKDDDDLNLLHSCSWFSGDNFHRVVMVLSVAQVQELVNAKTKSWGDSVLHKLAANIRQPKKETLEHLLKVGVNFAIVNGNGQTCLHVAATYGNVKATRLFLELGMHATVNVRDGKGETPLEHLLLNRYVKIEQLEEIGELLLSYGATLRNQVLHKAVSSGNIRLIPLLFLIKHVSTIADVNGRDINLDTPLHKCLRTSAGGIFEMAKMLLEKGADVAAKNKNGDTPFQILTENTRWFRPLEPKLMGFIGYVSKAALVSSAEAAQAALLLTIRASDSFRYEDFEKLANALVAKGAELRNEEGGGNDLLNECIMKRLLNGIKYILANGASVSALDSRGRSPLDRWQNSSQLDLEVFLLFVAKDEELDPRTSADATRILFEVATYKGILRETELLQIAKSKLLAAANVRELNGRGASLLHCAVKSNYVFLVRFFMQNRADVNVRDLKGQTPLHVAVSTRDPKFGLATLKELLSTNETDVKAADHQGNTIIDLSLRQRSPPVVKYILETGHFDEIISADAFLFRNVSNRICKRTLQELFSRFTLVTGRSLQDVGRDSIDPENSSLLHAAVASRCNELVEFFLKEKLFVLSPLSENEMRRFSNLLHLCVRNTQQQYSRRWRRRVVTIINIIRKLVNQNQALLNSKDAEGRTPLLVANVDVYLLTYLVELGADCNCVDRNGNTVDILAANYLDPEDYNILAEALNTTRNLNPWLGSM